MKNIKTPEVLPNEKLITEQECDEEGIDSTNDYYIDDSRDIWLTELEGHADSEEVDISSDEMLDDIVGGDEPTYHKTTVGALKNAIKNKASHLRVQTKYGSKICKIVHDIRIRIVTPEQKATEKEREKILNTLKALENLGMKTDILYTGSRYDEFYHELAPDISLSDILLYAKIIEKYLENTKDENDEIKNIKEQILNSKP